MFYPITLLAFLFVASSATVMSQVQPVEEQETNVIEMEEPVKRYPKSTFEITKDMVDIHPLQGNATAKVGQQIVYSASVHGSVGYSASAGSSSDQWFPLVETHLEYENEDKAQMSGGDAATKYFVFEAKKVGTYEVNARHYFRGDLENDFTIVITVVGENDEIEKEETKIDNLEETKPVQTPTEKSQKKIRRKLKKVEISGSRGSETVKVGQRLKYSADIHGSVGISASVVSSDDTALPLVKNNIRYDNPVRARRMPGGDSATEHFVFKAKKAGTYEIRIRHSFRGEVREDYTVVVTVIE